MESRQNKPTQARKIRIANRLERPLLISLNENAQGEAKSMDRQRPKPRNKKRRSRGVNHKNGVSVLPEGIQQREKHGGTMGFRLVVRRVVQRGLKFAI
jgi:hypothetical protein